MVKPQPLGRRVGRAVPLVVWAVVSLAATLGPEDVRSNLAQWASLLGIDSWPRWLTDQRVIIGLGIIVLAIYVRWRWRDKRAEKVEQALAGAQALAPIRATQNVVRVVGDEIKAGVTASEERILSVVTGKALGKLADEAGELAAEIERWLEAQLAEYRDPGPPFIRPGPGPTIHEMQLVNTYLGQYGERVQRLRDQCAARSIHEPSLDAVYDRPTGNQSLYSIVNGLRQLADKLGAQAGRAVPIHVTCKPALLPHLAGMKAVLEVTNDGPTDEFQAQVVEWGRGDNLSRLSVASLKWVENGATRSTLANGITGKLEIATLERGLADPRLTNSDGEPARGMVSVLVDWLPRDSLRDAAYWNAEDFESSVWSLHVVVSGAKCIGPHHQGVRLHLFGKSADAPPPSGLSASGWVLSSPTLRIGLFDLTPAGVKP